MNVFYNYNLGPVCNAIAQLGGDNSTCPGKEIDCIQKTLYAFMSNANIIYFWLHFDDNAKKMIFNQCKQIQGFNVDENLFNQAFDLNPDVLIQASNATAPANATSSAWVSLSML